MRDDVTATLSAAQMNVLMHSRLEWKSFVQRRHAKKFPFSGYETPHRAGVSVLELKDRHRNQVGNACPSCSTGLELTGICFH